MTQWKKKRQTMRHYDHLAPLYDAQYHEEQEAKIKAALNGLILKEENFILDAGCGTGLLYSHVSERVKFVVGIDTSKTILKTAKNRGKKLANLAVIRADTDYTPFKNQVFDAAFAITLLQNLPNPQKTLNEMKRITRQNPPIVVTGLKKAFSEKELKHLLRKARLKIKVFRQDKNLKEYVAVCTKSSKKTLKEPQRFCNSPEE